MKITPGYILSTTDQKDRQILKEALVRGVSDRLFICEQLRFAYDFAEQLPDTLIKTYLIETLIDIFGSAKKMNARLAHYKRHFGGETGNSGKNIKVLTDMELRKQIRKSRII